MLKGILNYLHSRHDFNLLLLADADCHSRPHSQLGHISCTRLRRIPASASLYCTSHHRRIYSHLYCIYFSMLLHLNLIHQDDIHCSLVIISVLILKFNHCWNNIEFLPYLIRISLFQTTHLGTFSFLVDYS